MSTRICEYFEDFSPTKISKDIDSPLDRELFIKSADGPRGREKISLHPARNPVALRKSIEQSRQLPNGYSGLINGEDLPKSIQEKLRLSQAFARAWLYYHESNGFFSAADEELVGDSNTDPIQSDGVNSRQAVVGSNDKGDTEEPSYALKVSFSDANPSKSRRAPNITDGRLSAHRRTTPSMSPTVSNFSSLLSREAMKHPKLLPARKTYLQNPVVPKNNLNNEELRNLNLRMPNEESSFTKVVKLNRTAENRLRLSAHSSYQILSVNL